MSSFKKGSTVLCDKRQSGKQFLRQVYFLVFAKFYNQVIFTDVYFELFLLKLKSIPSGYK